MGVGLMRSLQPPDILWIHWRVYNFIVNTSKRVLFLAPSDAYVRSFLYLLYTLIKLYYTHTHTHKKNTGVGCHFLLQGIFPTQELNPGLLHCRQVLYQL